MPFDSFVIPQQDGIIERNNRTIFNITRSMLKSKRLPKEFWVEVVACAVYLSNRSLKQIYGVRHHKRHEVAESRVFGSIAHVYILNKRRTKLDEKIEKLIFICNDNNLK